MWPARLTWHFRAIFPISPPMPWSLLCAATIGAAMKNGNPGGELPKTKEAK